MNYYEDDYILGHIQKQMRLTGLNKLEIDFLNNTTQPNELLTAPIKKSIDRYVSWLPRLVSDSKSDIKMVTDAKLMIEFDLSQSRICSFASEYTENPYICISIITDDRGKEYRYEFRDWWFPEASVIENMKINFWTRLMKWIKRK